MRRLVKDEHKAEEEKKAKLTKLQEDKKRNEYLTALKENDLFQKYVVTEILQKHINELTDLRNIKNADFDKLEEVGKLVLQAKATRIQLEKILSDLLN